MRCLISIRERSIMECFDLAMVLMRRYWWQLGLASLPGMLCIAAVGSMFQILAKEEFAGVFFIVVFWIILFYPLFSWPITWYLGQIMFYRPVTAKLFWQSFKKSWASLFWLAFVLRLIMMPLVFTFLIYPNFILEICLLEQQSTKNSWKRTKGLSRISPNPPIAWYCLYTLVGTIFIAGAAWGFAELWQMIRYQVGFQENILTYIDPTQSILPVLLFWPVGIYVSVVRFLGYLDVRTRMEGWAVSHRLSALSEELVNGR